MHLAEQVHILYGYCTGHCMGTVWALYIWEVYYNYGYCVGTSLVGVNMQIDLVQA